MARAPSESQKRPARTKSACILFQPGAPATRSSVFPTTWSLPSKEKGPASMLSLNRRNRTTQATLRFALLAAVAIVINYFDPPLPFLPGAKLGLSQISTMLCLEMYLSLIHISEPTRLGMISYAVFCLKKKKNINKVTNEKIKK